MKYYCQYCGMSYNKYGSHEDCFHKAQMNYLERVKNGMACDDPYIEKDISRRDE